MLWPHSLRRARCRSGCRPRRGRRRSPRRRNRGGRAYFNRKFDRGRASNFTTVLHDQDRRAAGHGPLHLDRPARRGRRCSAVQCRRGDGLSLFGDDDRAAGKSRAAQPECAGPAHLETELPQCTDLDLTSPSTPTRPASARRVCRRQTAGSTGLRLRRDQALARLGAEHRRKPQRRKISVVATKASR
jgi:hypothetical protein